MNRNGDVEQVLPATAEVRGDNIDARGSQGLLYRPSGSVTQHFRYGWTAAEVEALLLKVELKPYTGECPYVGLRAFQEVDGGRFFGRDALIDDLLQRIGASRFVAITGPSGSGKSSLARAGLLRSLRLGAIAGSHSWAYEAMTPGHAPLRQLASALARAKSPDLADFFARNAADDPMALHKSVASVVGEGRRFVLLVDQFEEVFTQAAPAEARQFIAQLTAAIGQADGLLTVVLAMRSDFVTDCAAHPGLTALFNSNSVLVGAMSPSELRQAIVQPALTVGLRVEPALVEHIIEDMAGEPGALPLMQFALQDVFAARHTPQGVDELRLADYLKRGGIESSLRRHADAAFGKLAAEERALAREIFSGLIALKPSAPPAARTMPIRQLMDTGADAGGAGNGDASHNGNGARAAQINRVLSKLAQARLVTLDGDTARLAHETLLRAWPWLTRLMDEERRAIELATEIAGDEQAWRDSNHDPSYLYRDAQLTAMQARIAAAHLKLATAAQAFIHASVEASEAEQARQQLALKREAERERLRYLRQAYGGAVGTGIGCSLAFALAAFAAVRAATPAQQALTLVFVPLLTFPLGAAMGFAIGAVLRWVRHRPVAMVAAATAAGGTVGALLYQLLVIGVQTNSASASAGLNSLVAGGLMGGGLGLAISLARTSRQRVLFATVIEAAAAAGAAAIAGVFSEHNLPLAAALGGLLGACSGLGFVIAAAKPEMRLGLRRGRTTS